MRNCPGLLLLGATMKSTMWIISVFSPVWFGDAKCLPMGSLSLFLVMLPKCIKNLSVSFYFIWPTYCFLQMVQVMQYIRLWLLHDTCFLVV